MTLLFNGKFKSTDKWVDTNHFTGTYGSAYNSCLLRPDSLVVVPDNRFGYVGKFTIKPEDFCNSVNPGNIRERAELQIPDSINNIGATLTYNEIWISWSEMLDNSWDNTTDTGWYAFTGLASYHFFIGGINGEFNIQFSSTTDINNLNLIFRYNPFLGYAKPENYFKLVTLEKGKWFDFMLHVKFAKDNTGFYEMYVRKPNETQYTLYLSQYNVVTQQTNPSYPDDFIMSKFGIYRSYPHTMSMTKYHTGVIIGTTQNDVYYEQYCPLPQCDFTIKEI